MLESITVYVLNSESMYEQFDIKTSKGNVSSKVFSGFEVALEDIFA